MKTSHTKSWLEMPSPFETEFGKLLLREPPTTCASALNALRARLLDESYQKPLRRRRRPVALPLLQTCV
jgi:hypothetical protein